MTVGMSGANTVNGWLNTLRGGGVGVSYTAPAVQAVRLYVGDPGSAGASNQASGDTSRKAVTFGAAVAGVLTMSSTPPVWTNGGTTEILTHIGVHDSTTVGNFMYSGLLSAPQSWASGNTFTLTALTVTVTPIAA